MCYTTVASTAGELAVTGRVIMYDGICNLCNSAVRFIAKRDPAKRLTFCSVQSPKAVPYLRGIGLTQQDALKRFVFIQDTRWSEGSTAALEIAGYLTFPWPLLKTLLVVPFPVREAVFDLVAKNRYRLFGATPCCQVPDVRLLERFLDSEDLVLGRCKDLAMQQADWEEGEHGQGQQQGGQQQQEQGQQQQQQQQQQGAPQRHEKKT